MKVELQAFFNLAQMGWQVNAVPWTLPPERRLSAHFMTLDIAAAIYHLSGAMMGLKVVMTLKVNSEYQMLATARHSTVKVTVV